MKNTVSKSNQHGFSITQSEANARYRKFAQSKQGSDSSNAPREIRDFCAAMELLTCGITRSFSFDDVARQVRLQNETIKYEATKAYFAEWLSAMEHLNRIEAIEGCMDGLTYLIL
jgi:hypothetical protein